MYIDEVELGEWSAQVKREGVEGTLGRGEERACCCSGGSGRVVGLVHCFFLEVSCFLEDLD